MRRVVVSPDARRDLLAILRESRTAFGADAARRYRLLIEQAYADLRDDPTRASSRIIAGLPEGIRLYDMRYSRLRLHSANRVGDPRHVVAYRFTTDRIDVVAVLHERMDIADRLKRR